MRGRRAMRRGKAMRSRRVIRRGVSDWEMESDEERDER